MVHLYIVIDLEPALALDQWRSNFGYEAGIVDPALKPYIETGRPRWELFERLRKDVGERKLVSVMVSSVQHSLRPWDFRVQSWREEFEQSLREINKESKLDFAMSGTVDVYSDEQTSLFGKGYLWNPRPVIQSYSAYTPELIRLNEQHLWFAGARDHLVFRLEPIDGQFPP